MQHEDIKIRKFNGEFVKLSLEAPETDEEYSNGLAFRDSIPQNTGMLYVWDEWNLLGEARMFTPDTKFPVDFIFLDETGTIIKIHHNAKPLCKDIISCYSTKFVIELTGGECKRLDINVGDVMVANNKKQKQVFKTPKFVDGIFYKSTGTYFCKTPSELYMYSYRTHLWTLVEERAKWRFYGRDNYLEQIKDEHIISSEQAKEQCIKRDKELINDLKENLKYYYKLSNYLFVTYDYQDNSLKYYDYKKGWIEIENVRCIYPFDFKRYLDKIRWFSMVQTKKEIDKAIDDINKNETKKNLLKINKENKERLNQLEYNACPYCKVFYIDDDTKEWKGAIIPGSKAFVELQCEKYKLEKNWKDFYVYKEEYDYCPVDIEFDVNISEADVEILVDKVEKLLEKDKFQEAIDTCKEAARNKKCTPMMYDLIAEIYYNNLGDYDNALRYINEAITLNYITDEAYFLRGRILCDVLHIYCLAVLDFEQAIAIKKDNHFYNAFAAYAYVHKGELDETVDKELALKDYERAIELYKIAHKLEFGDNKSKDAGFSYKSTVGYAQKLKDRLLNKK